MVRVAVDAEGTLTMEATDLTHFARVNVETYGGAGSGSALVSAAFMRHASMGEGGKIVCLRVSADWRARVGTNRATHVRSALPVGVFPPAPHGGDHLATFGADVLARAIAATRHAVSSDDTRPHLAGVCLDVAKARVIATDGHRIAYAPAACARTARGAVSRDRPVLPRVLLAAVAGMHGGACGSPALRASELAAELVCPNGERVSWWRDTAYTFPETEGAHVFATWDTTEIAIDTRALLGDVDAATGGYFGDLRAVVLALARDGDRLALRVTSHNQRDPDAGGDVVVTHELRQTTAAQDFRVGIRAAYLADALRACGDSDAVLRAGRELDPVTIETTSDATKRTFVIMPVRA